MKILKEILFLFKAPFVLRQTIRDIKLNSAKLDILITSQMMMAKDNPSALLVLNNLWRSPIITHKHKNLLRYLKLFRPYASPSLDIVRIGGKHDGGYCMLLPPPPAGDNKPKAISLGVSSDSPWDLDMASRGYEVLEIDGSIESSPYPDNPNITFIKKFIGEKNDENFITLSQVIKDFKLDKNAHNILQCDIENAEWDMLEQIDMDLLKEYFSQMVFEFHRCYPNSDLKSKKRFKVLEQIDKLFVPIWTHFNSNGAFITGDGLFFCSLVEVCYIRRDLLPSDAKPVSGFYRLGIDSQNTPDIPDIPLFFPHRF